MFAPRYFLQTAKKCGVPTVMVRDILDETADGAPAAIDQAFADLPKDFPEAIAESIVEGLCGRLRLFEGPAA